MRSSTAALTSAVVSARAGWISKLLQRIRWPASFALLFAAYLYADQLQLNTSDNASIILEAQAMLHGNILLHGWYLPPDSFITTEMPLDALGSLLFTGPQLLKITPALLYAATVVGAGWLAGRQIPDTCRRRLAVVACVALIAFPIGRLFDLVSQGPMHVGTIVVSLIAWWAYAHAVDSTGRRCELVGFALFALLTTLAIVGDPMAELLLVAPVALLGGWVLLCARGRDPTAWTALAAAVSAWLAGSVLRQLLLKSGTFLGSTSLHLASPPQIWAHLQWLLLGLCLLFHIDLRHHPFGLLQLLILTLNAGFLVVAVVGFLKLFRHTLFPLHMRQSLPSVLSWSIVGSILVFVFSDLATGMGQLRYLLPASVYAGILCYAALAQVASRRNLRLVIVTFLFAGMLTGSLLLLQTPAARPPQEQLILFLERHHLRMGLGTFWDANIITLQSGEEVRVAPVVAQGGRIYPRRWHASAAWFTAAQLASARFVVTDGRVPLTSFLQAVTATFGAPDHIYHLAGATGYVIFVWDHPIGDSKLTGAD
jgi:hypothetical protein